MYFHHLHFYVRDTAYWNAWFTHKLGFLPVSSPTTLTQGDIDIRLSSPEDSPHVAKYLKQHPPGLVDIAFATDQFDTVLTRYQKQANSQTQNQGAALLEPVSVLPSGQRQCQLKGWAHLRHTLIEVSSVNASDVETRGSQQVNLLSLIDHVVINVPKGELSAAVKWYQTVFGLALGQSFEINTANSGLRSQVLVHPDGTLQLPINEPSSANSQSQEFLNHNRGAGVQHVALRTQDAVGAIAHFRKQGLQLLDVPNAYYEGLKDRPDCPQIDFSAISHQQLLLDWHHSGEQGMLLQTFTRPIFDEPTFFFEIIERSPYQDNGQLKVAQGFGEGNFQALFEAIERSQIERGSLIHKD